MATYNCHPVPTAHFTHPQEAYADLKKEKMSTGDGYLLVYAITDDTTFGKLDRVRDEIMKAQSAVGKPAGSVPIFLIGTKADLSTDRAVSEKERLAKARAWNCKSFEVSAKTNNGIGEVFEQIIQDVLVADANKGSGGGSVMGAGRTPSNASLVLPQKKKACVFL